MKRLLPLLLLTGLLGAGTSAQAQLTGLKTIDPAGSGPNNYPTFTAAVTALNTQGVGPTGVTLQLPANAVYDEVVPALTASGTAAGRIVFQKTGLGANPKIQGTGTGATDAALILDGADYVTLDGLDLEDKAANGTPVQQLEYGLWVRNGATNNLVQNGTIDLNRANTNKTYGVFQDGGLNNNNRYYSLLVQDAFYGYNMDSGSTNYDTGTEIGVTSTQPLPSRVLNLGSPSTSTGGATGIVYGIYLRSQTNARVFNTEIAGLAGPSAVYGVYSTGANNSAEVVNCQVHGMSSSNSTGAVQGIYVASGTTHTIARNRTYDIESLGTNGFASGMDITAGTTNYVYNNFVYDIRAAASGAGTSVRALSFRGGTNNYLFHNTVVINYAATNPANKSGALYISGASTPLDARNNIFVNLVSGLTPGGGGVGAAFFKNTNSVATIAAATNNNLYYAGTPSAEKLIFYGVNSTAPALDQTLAQYKARITPAEQASVTELPPFVNQLTDPHLLTTQATQAESGGIALGSTPLAVPADIDLDLRNATTPDIGADEGSFISANDVTAPSITYTPLTNTSALTSRTLSAVGINDAGTGVNVATGTRPRLYFRKKTDANVFGVANDATGNGWKYTEALTGSSSPFNFTLDVSKLRSAPVPGDSIFYFVTAQDQAPTPNVAANPSAGFAGTGVGSITAAPTRPQGYLVLGLISGVKTVGVSAPADFPTLTAAATYFNTNELSGALTFRLIDTNYPNETYPITLRANPGSSTSNSLRVELASTVTSSAFVTPAATTTPALVVDASFVTIDGASGGTGITRGLSLENLGSASSSGGVFVSGSDVTLRALRLAGTAGSTSYGVAYNGALNGIVANCRVVRMATGIQAQAGSNNFIANNNDLGDIGTPTVPPLNDRLNGNGIVILNSNDFVVRGNLIAGLTRSTASSVSGVLVSGTSMNGVISRNLIRDVKQTGTTTLTSYGAYGIRLSSTAPAANVAVVNNMILDVLSPGDNGADFSPHGIYLGSGGGYSLAFNSVNMSGNLTLGTTPVSGAVGIASTVTDVRLVDNLLVNQQSFTPTAGRAYALYSEAAATALTFSNNNSYFAGPLTGQGRLAYLTGAERSTLAALRTATGQDLNSLVSNPVFSNPSLNLLLAPNQNCSLDGAGRPVTGITDDFRGQPRSATTPDIGADEFVPVALTAPTAVSQTITFGQPVAPLTASGLLGTAVWYGNAALTQRLFAGPSYTPSQTAVGTYTYFVVDSVNACRSAATTVTLTIRMGAGTRASLSGTQLSLHPNPASAGQGSATLSLSGPAATFVAEPRDVLGRSLGLTRIEHAGGEAQYPLRWPATAAPGVYVVPVRNTQTGQTTTLRLVLE